MSENTKSDRERSVSAVSALEALLFVSGEPLLPEELSGISGRSIEDVQAGLAALEKALAERGSGLRLLRGQRGEVQLTTTPEQGATVEAFLKAGMREQLTSAAAETLAIIAYRGPLHRAGIEAIRGVNSSFTLRLLTMRGLLERSPSRKDSRVFLYRLTTEFLRQLGMRSVEELPEYASLHAHEGMNRLERTADGTSPAGEAAGAAT
jgi:segregation and condensation protein B